MIAIDVDYAVAERTEVFGFENGHAKPSLNHGFEVKWVDVLMHGLGRNSVEPLPSAASRREVEVGLAGRVGAVGLKQGLAGVFVQGFGEGLLSWGFAMRHAVDASGTVDIRVEVLPSFAQGRRARVPDVVGVELGAEFVASGAGGQVSCRAMVANAV